MNLPLLTITALAGELRKSWVGGIITGVESLFGTGLCLQAARALQTTFLCVGTHPSCFFPFLCTKPHLAGRKSPFVRSLRRLLDGYTITSVEQWRYDRILRIEFRKIEEIHGVRQRALILELIPRRQNMIMVDLASGVITEVLRQVTGEMSRVRHVLPNHPYQPPPRLGGVHPRTSSPEEFLKAARLHPREQLEKALIRCLPWASGFLLNELFLRKSLDISMSISKVRETELLNLWKIVDTWVRELESGPPRPTLILGLKNHSQTLLPYEPESVPHGQKRFFATLSQALEYLFGNFTERWAGEKDRRAMAAAMNRALRRGRRALKKLEVGLSDSRRAEEYKKLGEVIAANMARLKKGMSQAHLPDPYSTGGKAILVPLDPRLSPADNAQRYFKRFRKAKAGLPKIESRFQEVDLFLQKLEGLRQALRASSQRDKMEEIKSQLSQLGIQIFSEGAGRSSRDRRSRKQPLTFTLGDGWTLWVGRNNRENELLTHRMADHRDLWFHAQGVSGSHVILRREGRKEAPSKKVLEEAASVAAYFSRARHSKTAPVVYTEKRYVRKPRGAKPGLVAIEREKTLFVAPKLIPRDVEK
ncbi:MAG: hypothetical protein AMJ92_07925 [candidate division Zixibacteria bacterium SM23_81]|nr:MAG: hypothetical protein AMJ92_07925 [candidate division Zixibacteria bacterium SM23_81]